MRFAFIWQGIQYTFSHLSQGLNHSLTIRVAHAMLAEELEMLTFPQEVTVGQRICDTCLKRQLLQGTCKLATGTCYNNISTAKWNRYTRGTETRAQSQIHLLGSQMDSCEKSSP